MSAVINTQRLHNTVVAAGSPHLKNQSTKKLSGERHKTVDVLQKKENFNSLHRVICHVLSIIRYHREPTASIARGRGGVKRNTKIDDQSQDEKPGDFYWAHTHIPNHFSCCASDFCCIIDENFPKSCKSRLFLFGSISVFRPHKVVIVVA